MRNIPFRSHCWPHLSDTTTTVADWIIRNYFISVPRLFLNSSTFRQLFSRLICERAKSIFAWPKNRLFARISSRCWLILSPLQRDRQKSRRSPVNNYWKNTLPSFSMFRVAPVNHRYMFYVCPCELKSSILEEDDGQPNRLRQEINVYSSHRQHPINFTSRTRNKILIYS